MTELPVRTSLKAASTLVESNADVSINMRPFFSGLVSVVEDKGGGGNHNELTLIIISRSAELVQEVCQNKMRT